MSANRRALGWCVHAYTATGLLLSAAVAGLLVQPDPGPEAFRSCFLLFLVAVLVDATDGTLARLVRIGEAVPEFDGRRLDDLVDFLTYTCLPLLLIDRAGLLPPDARWVLLVALVASGYGFCQTDIKTPDGAFVGFPSYWNIVAYYLYRLPAGGWAAAGIILALAALTFVPTRYPYPTRPGRANRWMLVLSVPWTGLILADLLRPWAGRTNGPLVWASATYPAAYLGVAWAGAVGRRTGRRGR
ncbi:MAG: CDP-alcohol phosphatidyltransferase [Gemmataceae bacterium]|nr:CDP-alcohol phosphatidyltransferase [Gemmataceae bacterium]